jgi:UDP-N-acetylmuramoyl-tripeptide--D-alanyl-D-alanine ligase
MAWREPDPRKQAKKKFVMTARAQRIFIVALTFGLLIGAWSSAGGCIITWIVAVQAMPLALVLANIALMPFEARIQKRFWDEAHARLLQIHPDVVGVTGSFGKTSVKHILGHVLEMNARTYFTPGSVNTPMGIARIIRENLPADCRYFLVEMGAYGPGSIERLCRLTPPDFGIITAIGEAHYERYKSLDAVAHAKFELAEAVLRRPQGKIIVHDSVLQQAYARSFIAAHPDRFVLCGPGEGSAFRIEKIEQTRTGLTVDVQWQGQPYQLSAPLFGAHHADNIAVVFAAAVTLGIASERVIAALRTVPQIQHRLEVKPQPNGVIHIDDAFNSNPRGFVAALEMMTLLAEGGGQGGGRRILVTPGVAELGERNDSVHNMLGEKAAALVDVAFVVRSDRIPGFAAGFRRAGGKELREVPALSDALAWLNANTRAGDVVLFENDLPDVLERKLTL